MDTGVKIYTATHFKKLKNGTIKKYEYQATYQTKGKKLDLDLTDEICASVRRDLDYGCTKKNVAAKYGLNYHYIKKILSEAPKLALVQAQ